MGKTEEQVAAENAAKEKAKADKKVQAEIDQREKDAKAAADKLEKDEKAAADKLEKDEKAAADKAEKDEKAAAEKDDKKPKRHPALPELSKQHKAAEASIRQMGIDAAKVLAAKGVKFKKPPSRK